MPFSDPRRADEHRRAAVGGLARQRLDRRAAGGLERRLEHQILGRIAGDEQLREHDEVGAVGGRLRASAAHLFGVAGDVADGGIELGERDGEAVGGTGVHGPDLTGGSRLADGAITRATYSGNRQPLAERARSQRSAPASSQRDADRGRADVLDAADARIGVAAVTRSPSFSIAVLSSSTTMMQTMTRINASRFHGLGRDQEGERHRDHEATISCRNAASLRATARRPFQVLSSRAQNAMHEVAPALASQNGRGCRRARSPLCLRVIERDANADTDRAVPMPAAPPLTLMGRPASVPCRRS